MPRTKRPRRLPTSRRRESADSDYLTLEDILEATERVFDWLAPVDEQLQKAGKPALARKYFEEDIQHIVSRFGWAGDHTTQQTVSLAHSLVTHLHPTLSAECMIETVIRFSLQNGKADRINGLAPMTRPRTLELVESYDLDNGTYLAKPVCMILITIAVYVATVDGKMSAQQEADLATLREVSGWIVINDVGKVIRPSLLPVQ